MYRDNHQDTFRHINFLYDDGGLGDAVARLPAVYYAAVNNPFIQIHLWVPDYFKDFAKNCLRNTNVIIRGFSDGSKYKEHFLARAFSIHKYNTLASHLTDNAFHVLINKDVGPEDMNYLKPDLTDIDITKFNLPDKYVVMSTGFTAPSREMYPATVNAVVDYIKSKNYDVVFLGKKDTHTGMSSIKGNFKVDINFTNGVNLIDKTSLLETTKIIGNSSAIVGLDNGLLHVAGSTDVAIVGAFSTVDPRHRMPYRNDTLGWNFYPVVPLSTLKCRFCQSNWQFTYDHTFTECFYKDYECLKQLSSDLYIEQLNKVL